MLTDSVFDDDDSEEDDDVYGFEDSATTDPDIPHLDEYHEYLSQTRDQGQEFMDFHQWHLQNYGDFGIRG